MATTYSSVVSSRPLPIDVERRAPWNRWFFKLAHYWRYGYLHPDEDLLGVIEAAGDAIKVHAMAARTELSGPAAIRAADVVSRLEAELNKTIPDFATLLGLEAEINTLYPPEQARYRRWIIRERFERVASPGAVQSWRAAQVAAQLTQAATRPDSDDGASGGATPPPAAGNATPGDATPAPSGAGTGSPPPPPPATPPTGTGDGGGPGGGDQGEVQALLGYVHSSYLLSIAREKAVRDLKRWLLMRFWFFLAGSILTLALVGGILLLAKTPQYWGLAVGLFLVAIAGRMGATTSVIRRMQTAISGNVLARDPILELTALRTGKNEISLALLTSSIFALLLYAFFLTGVPHMLGFQDGVFPRAQATQRSAVTATPAPSTAPAAVGQTVIPPAPVAAPARIAPAPPPVTAPSVNAVAPANDAAPAAGGNVSAAAATNLAAPAEATNAVAPADETKPQSNAPATDEAATSVLKLTCGPGVDCNPFDNLANMLGLVDGSDFFKLLIWAFIAGFAERFVPDVLDRVVARGRANASEPSGNLIAAQLSGGNPTPGAPAPSTPSPDNRGRAAQASPPPPRPTRPG
jgi:hypothetical protein